MPVKQAVLEDIGLVKLYKRRGVRAIKITLTADSQVRVTLPPWMTYRAALLFVLSKKAWIKQHQRQVALLAPGFQVGKYHRLQFVLDQAVTTPSARVTDTLVKVLVPAGLAFDNPTVQQAAKLACRRALRQEAGVLLPQRLSQLARQHGFVYQSVKIKNLKSRWGSCNQQRHISLSLYLMQLPWQLIDYVLLHELNHTQHLSHSKLFWANLELYSPGYKQLRKDLKVYQPVI